jgi:hypothetical protein
MPSVNPATGAGTGQSGLTNPNAYPQWGFNQAGNIVEAKTAAQKQAYVNEGYLDWSSTQQGAESDAASQKGLGSGNIPTPDWSLDISGLKAWFFRGLMVAGGLFLMGYGVSKMLNVENKVTEIASKIPVVPV